MTTGHAQEHGRHPTFKQYLVVATALFLITIAEFLLIWPDRRLTGILLVVVLFGLSAIKFGTVIMFYMHLKFDSRLFSYVFLGGLALAFAVGLALLGLFAALKAEAQPRGFAQEKAVPYIPEHGGGGALEPKPDSGAPAAPADQLALGKSVFTGKGACSACHTIQGVSAGTVGPELTHIGTEGAMEKPGMSADAYIRESIEEPSAFVAPTFQPLMPAGLKGLLSKGEFEALVAFLLAQK
jgi:cytochrome c oxidase subunit 4